MLPEHHHDERGDQRAAGHIEAFLTGPTAPPRAPHPSSRERRPLTLDTRQDWVTALRYEAARHARYGRPASVLLVGLRGSPPEPAVERLALAIADVIRAEARETDRAVRTGRLTFRLLLPETGGRAARSLAERLERAYRSVPDGQAEGVALTVEVATAPPSGRLEDAVTEAEVRFDARSAAG